MKWERALTDTIIIILTIILSAGLADVETAVSVLDALRAIIQLTDLTNAT